MTLVPSELTEIGQKLPTLIVSWASWIDRRVEQFEPIDRIKVRRYCSVDFRLPNAQAVQIGGTDQVLVPFSFLRKTTLHNFSLRDDEGRALPFLIRDENAHVAVALLSGLLQRAVSDGRRDEIESAIPEIVLGAPETAAGVVRSLHPPAGADGQAWNEFIALAADFAHNFLGLTLVPNSWVGERRVIKYQYDSLLGTPKTELLVGWWRGLGRWLGVRAVWWQLGVGELGSTRSYHAEVIVPPSMVIGHAELRQTYEDSDKFDVLDWDQTDHSRPHLHRENLARGIRGAVVADLWMNPDGTTRTAFAISWVVSVTLLCGLVAHSMHWPPAADPVIAVLVAVPGAFAAALVNPFEHGLVKVMARGMRERTALAAALSFAGAAVLSVKAPIGLVAFVWRWLAIASVANTFVLFWGLRVSRRFGDPLLRRSIRKVTVIVIHSAGLFGRWIWQRIHWLLVAVWGILHPVGP